MSRYIFYFALVICVAGCDRKSFKEQTIFAPGYSEKNFHQIHLDTTESEVLRLIGLPLTTVTQRWSESWFYFRPGASITNRHLFTSTFVFDVPEKVTELSYNNQGVVTNVSGDFLKGDFAGLNKEAILSKIGKPNRVDLRVPSRIFWYTLPKPSGSGSYEVRQVYIGESNLVYQIVDGLHYD